MKLGSLRLLPHSLCIGVRQKEGGRKGGKEEGGGREGGRSASEEGRKVAPRCGVTFRMKTSLDVFSLG